MPVNAEQVAPPQVIKGQELQRVALRAAAGESDIGQGLQGNQKDVLNASQGKFAEKNPTDALDLISTGLTETPADVQRTADIYFKIPDTVLSTVDQARVAQLNGVYEGLHNILGNSPVDAAQMKAIGDIFMAGIGKSPELAAIFMKGTSPDLDKIQRFLGSKAGEHVATNLNNVLKQAKEGKSKVLELNDKIGKNRQEIIKAEHEVNTAEADRNNLRDVQKNLTEFNDPTSKDGQARLDVLANELKTSGSADPGIFGFTNNLSERAQLTARQRSGIALTATEAARLGDLNTWIENAKADSTHGVKTREAENIFNRKQVLIDTATEVAKNPNAVANAEAKLKLAQKALFNLRETENGLVDQHNDISTEFESSMQNVIRESAVETFRVRVAEFMAQYPNYEKAALDELEKAAREKLHTHVDARYKKSEEKGIIFKRVKQGYDADKVSADMKDLLSGNPPNPDALLNKWMADAKLSDAEKAAISNNPDTMQALRADLTAKLFVASTQSGQRFNERQIRAIADTKWGGPALDQMLTQNADIKRYLEKIVGKGYGSKDVLNKFGALNFIMLILMALGIVQTPGVPLSEN